ncbi:hypothetical protein A4X09_0g6174 [Tilletia walkeri]|uniref:General alpha-glucoside permease n=1 Tax=Tilletia walkeri TaxID=117179 RepID=A0A8X7N4B9_9BASI|nr:hypothetical protein A4X09_0g6174 [Tilletia walkeri]
MASSSSSSSFLAVPSTSTQHPINNDHYNNNEEEEDDDDDDDATIGLRTPTLSSTPSSSSPYSSPAHNISQATILPPPSHTYTSLGSHLSLEHPPSPSPLPLPTSPSPPTATPPPSSFLNRLHTLLKQTPLSFFKRSPSSSQESLSSLSLFTLTLALAGAQLSWTLELAYGNIFLLSLGLSKSHSALVWLAGPLSGLIAQPLIGAWSDRIAPSSKWRIVRRRVFLIISGVIIVLSTLLLAFVQPCARWLVDAILRIGEADWDPDRLEAVDSATKFLAILAFWILDLALNALQASARALILDVAPRQQQSQANAWHGRMTHAGNVVGYAAGWMDLGSLHALSWLGGGQFRKLAVVSLVGMGVCVAVTCLCTTEGGPTPPSREQEEEEADSLRADIERPRRPTTSSKRKPKSTKKKKRKKQESQNALFALLSHISKATRTLPQPIARVCLVQLFAFSSWFPFLFFSTTYVVELQRRGHKGDGDGNGDKDTERGSFAMMLYAIVALGAGGILPYLAVASGRKKTTPSPTIAQSEDAGQPPITETAGGTVIYQRAVEEGGSSPSMSSAVLDEEHQEEEVQQLGFTSFIEHERRHSSSEPAREEDEEEEEDSPLLPQEQQQQQQHSAGLLHNWTLRSLWTLGGILTFVLLTLGTSLISLLIEDEKMQVRAAMGVVGLMGVPWAVASWVPFALLGEFLKEAEEVVSEPEEEEGDEGGRTRESVRDALVGCRPLPSGRGVPSSSSSSKSRIVSSTSSSSSSRKNGKARRPAPPRRQASDLLPNEMPTHSSSDEDEDEEPIRRNSSSGAGGLRVLPTSEAYTRRLEEEELRRASAARRRMRQRQMDEEEAEERRRDLESDEEEEVSGEDEDEEDEEGDEGEGERVRKDVGGEGGGGKKGSSAGTILGIHNLAIVLPQFFVALIANLIFRLSSSEDGGDGVVWVLRFGGVMGLLAAFATRFVPLTRTEREDERLRRRSRRSKSKSKRARRMSGGGM